MARVYLARDVRHRRQVALKVLHPEIAQTVGSARFLREIETAANLQHDRDRVGDSQSAQLTDRASGLLLSCAVEESVSDAWTIENFDPALAK